MLYGECHKQKRRLVKKIIAFLRSMNFAVFLLVLIVIMSIIGSLIPQGNSVSDYAVLYPKVFRLVLFCKFDRIFSSWYFISILAFLCFNMALCSLGRIKPTWRRKANFTENASRCTAHISLTDNMRQKLRDYLESARYKKCKIKNTVVYYKNTAGFYGPAAVHFSTLLIIVFGALILYSSDTADYEVKPGESLLFADGTSLKINSFRITDETGRLDFTSSITVTESDGTVSGPVDISVNHPHAFGSRKYYQQTYGTCASISVRDDEGAEDLFTPSEEAFLSADGKNGVWYTAIYPGYVRDANGKLTIIRNTEGAYENPVYRILLRVNGENTPMLVFPGETVKVGNLTYVFNEPISYPGIRVKTREPVILAFLYMSFVFLCGGLVLCFFFVPVAVVFKDEGYAVYGDRTVGLSLELAAFLKNA